MDGIPKLALLMLFFATITAQQNYSGNSAIDCNSRNEMMLYSCNGEHHPCRAFLIFTAKSPYDSVTAIAALTSSDQYEIMKTNNVTRFTVFLEGQEVVVPVTCSCSGQYYQTTTTYEVTADAETYSTIANNTFQGLSTCNALVHSNVNQSEYNLQPGDELGVPLQCACPTKEQVRIGTKFLLTYVIDKGDTLYQLSKQFNVSIEIISEANGLPHSSSTIYPFTSILIPLPAEPSRSHLVTRRHDKAKSPLPAPVVRRSRSNSILSIAGIAAGALSLIILLLLVFIFVFHKKQTRKSQTGGRNTKVIMSPQPDLILEIARLDRTLNMFKFSEIKKATRNFASRNRISDCMYRGAFKGEVLAVKKSNRNADNEVKMLHQINHFNIVKLCGFCEHKDDLYLVCEYMENGSLQEWLTGGGSDGLKCWSELIRIALDVANGLLYLHKFTNPVHVHNNISSSNILLDGNLRAKIANFSLARTSNSNFIMRVVATKGYIAPECLEAGPVTPKVDVFAFGVVLLELITGKGPVFMLDGRERLLSTAVAAVMERPNAEIELSHFTVPSLSENGGMEYAVQMVKLSLSCLERDSADRPDMVEVVSILQKLQLNIQKPGYTANNKTTMRIESEVTFSSSSILSSI